MPGDTVQYQSQSKEVTSAVWDVVARKAGYLEIDSLCTREEIHGVSSLADHSHLWQTIAFLERFVAAAALLFSAPVLLGAAALVTLLSRRSPLIAHRRVGQYGQDLWVLKLRTMWGPQPNRGNRMAWVERLTDEPPVPDAKIPRDLRITSPVAQFCRKYSIDEIPQLWQVIRGDMALVGPRPLTAGEINKYYGGSAAMFRRIKPGLTGLWQIKGRNRLNYRQRRQFDRFMIEHWSLNLYLFIFAVTIPRVLFGKDAW